MFKKVAQEWNLEAPWGKLAMMSWGDPGSPPVLLVHGYSDTAASFIPLVDLLPDSYYYVAFDLPGHGLSAPAPGPPVSYLHFVECIRLVAERLQWGSFACIAHSMGYLICCCYNAAFPGRMSKLVNLDGSITIGWHDMTDYQDFWFQHCYDSCYKNYYPPPAPARYPREEAVALLMRTRSVGASEAAALVSRCLAPNADGTFRFTWDPKVKKISTALFSEHQLHAILAASPPTLNLVASEDISMEMFRAYTRKVVAKLEGVNNYFTIKKEGSHDMHLTNPGSLVKDIVEFLRRDFSVQSRL